MGLRDIGAELPPGFKFFPSDEELVCHYLYKKIANEDVHKGTLVEIDLHTCEPWQLPDVAKLNANEWYFFSFRDRKYATGFRTNRATISGYWKATGKDRTVHDPITRDIVGMRKTLVFYKNRAPNGVKTGWIMHEFRLETPHMPPKEDWVLCRVFHKSKEESCTQYMTLERTASIPSINLAASPPKQHTTFPCTHNQQFNPTSFYQNHHQNSLFHLLHLSQESKTTNNNAISEEINNPRMDEIGFLWDMNMDDDNNLGADGVSSSLGDIRFDMDNNGMALM